MSLIPVFEIGLWNAWIFELYQLLPLPLFLTALKKRAPAAGLPEINKSERKLLIFSKLIMFFPTIYAIFLPLKLGTTWLYIGLPITLLGLILYTVVWVNLATTPLNNEPASQGLFRYSRHPMYLASFLASIGVSIACASWLYLLISVISKILIFLFVPVEERGLLEKYGDAYREYMNRTPRYIGVPKAVAK